jgi:hypothetical protein
MTNIGKQPKTTAGKTEPTVILPPEDTAARHLLPVEAPAKTDTRSNENPAETQTIIQPPKDPAELVTALHEPIDPNKTLVYQGDNSEAGMRTAIYNGTASRSPQLEETFILPATQLKQQLLLVDKAFQEQNKPRESFFRESDLRLAEKYPGLNTDSDLSEISPYFPNEPDYYAKDFDKGFKFLYEKSSEDPNFEIAKHPWGTYLHSASKLLAGINDGNVKLLFPIIFKKLLEGKSTVPEAQIVSTIKELLEKRLKTRLAIVAKDFVKELTDAEKNVILMHTLVPRPGTMLKTQYTTVMAKASVKIAADAKYLDEDFFNGAYQNALKTAVELELGANLNKLTELAMKTENDRQHNAETKTILALKAFQVSEFKGLSRLVGIRSKPQNIDDRYQGIVASTADDLMRIMPKINQLDTETQQAQAEIFLYKLEQLSRAKAKMIVEERREDILNDHVFLEAVKLGQIPTAINRLKYHCGAENLENPLRRLYVLKELAGNFEVEKAIDNIPTRGQRFVRDIRAKAALALLVLTGFTGMAVYGASAIQEYRDPYADTHDISGITDATGILKDEVVKSTQRDLSEQHTWATKQTFSLNELLDASKRGILLENDSANLLANILTESPALKSMKPKNPLIIGLNIKTDAENNLDLKALTTELKERLNSDTDLLSDLQTSEEQDKIASEIIQNFNAVFQSFYAIKKHAPSFITQISIDDPKEPGKKIGIVLLNTHYLDSLLVDLEKDNQETRTEQLKALSATISQTGRSLHLQDLITDSYDLYASGKLKLAETAFTRDDYGRDSSAASAEINRIGKTVDEFRRSLKKETLH